jgi:error-prone DNA polymerase
MEIAIVAAGFTPAEADGLRRSMATFKAKGKVSDWHKKLVGGMTARGYTEEFANRVFKQLEGFGSYGFPESHAASFALLVYVSSYIKWKYPDVFAAALLNSMPMGFYQPAQIVIDARKHGVEMRSVDVNRSVWDNILEKRAGKYYAVRLGFRNIKGMSEVDAVALAAGRGSGYTAIQQLPDAGVSQAAIEKLTDADAFRSMGLDRREAWWEVSALQDKPVGMYTGQQPESNNEPQMALPLLTDAEHVVEDYASMGLSLKAHPVSFVREKLAQLHITATNGLAALNDGDQVKVAGLVLVRQRPGTASGICFITIEDETGTSNLVVFQKLFDYYRKEIIQSRLLMVEGKVQKEGEVIHVVVQRCFNLSKLLRGLTVTNNDDPPLLTLSRADERSEPIPEKRQGQAEGEVFYGGRNFR